MNSAFPALELSLVTRDSVIFFSSRLCANNPSGKGSQQWHSVSYLAGELVNCFTEVWLTHTWIAIVVVFTLQRHYKRKLFCASFIHFFNYNYLNKQELVL